MKNLARNYVYWRGIDKDIEQMVKDCPACIQKLACPAQQFHAWEQTSTPWCRIHADFADFEQQKFLLIVDSYSKWLEIVPMRSTTVAAVITVLRHVFACFGLPITFVSDNGPPFQSSELVNFFRLNGVTHKFAPPYHPNSNGQVERYVRTFKEALGADTYGSLSSRLNHFLLSYR